MSQFIELSFQTPLRSCRIEVGHEILFTPTFLALCRKFGNHVAIITDTSVLPLFGEPLLSYFKHHQCDADLFSFPAGEENKNRRTKEILEDEMLAAKLGRDTVIVALGGGVVTDMAGYIAATYCRGIPCLMVPTTLLAMVDAGIGGKTGVNTSVGKNLIGSTYQPSAIIADISLLNSLPDRELRNGTVEMIKHGLIADPLYFKFLEDHVDGVLNRDPEVLQQAIVKSCEIKRAIVLDDEHESGQRRLLNYGHTIGHAIEIVSGFKVSHGEAVAIGSLVEGYLSHQLGFLPVSSLKRIYQLFKSYQVNLWEDRVFSVNAMLEAISLDKKALNQQPRFALIQEIGVPLSQNGDFCNPVSEELLVQGLNWMNHDRCFS